MFAPRAWSVVEGLQDGHAGPLAQDEAATGLVERSAGSGRVVVHFGQRGQSVEAGDAEGVDHGVRPAGEHHVGVAAAEDLGRLAGGLEAGGAGGQAVEGRAGGVDEAGDVEQGHVRLLLVLAGHVHPLRRGPCPSFGVDCPRVAVPGGQSGAGVGVVIERPFAAAEVDADALGVDFTDGTRRPRLLRRPEGEAGVAADALEARHVEQFRRVVVPHLRADARRERLGREQVGARDAAAAGQQPPPDGLEVVAHRRDPAAAGDDDSVHGPL